MEVWFVSQTKIYIQMRIIVLKAWEEPLNGIPLCALYLC